jgi:probable HAF family extracellular repeat protein
MPTPTHPWPGRRSIGALLAATLATAAAHAAPVYRAYDLQTQAPAQYGIGLGLNSGGLATGSAYTGVGTEFHAFTATPGALTDLGSLGAGLSSAGQGVNAGGQVVGWSEFGTPGLTHAVIFDGGTIKDIGSAGGNVYGSYGFAINASGQATGRATAYFDGSPGYQTNAFFYDGTTTHLLGTLGGLLSSGQAINDAGLIAGFSQFGSGNLLHAFIYDSTGMHDLGTLGGLTSQAFGINNHNQVVGGAAGASFFEHAFVYDQGTMHDLGTLAGTFSSEAHAINDAGQVVGVAQGSGGTLGFFYDGLNMLDLMSLIESGFDGWRIDDLTGINAAGQIVGTASNGSVQHAFLFDPVQPAGGSVPEPGSLALVLTLCAAAACANAASSSRRAARPVSRPPCGAA